MMLYLRYVRWTLKEIKLFSDEFQTEFLKSFTKTLTSKHLPVSVHWKSGMKEKDILEYFPVATTARKEELVDKL